MVQGMQGSCVSKPAVCINGVGGGWSAYEIDIDNEEIMDYLEEEGLKVNKIPLFITKSNGVIKKMYQGKDEGGIKALLDDLVSGIVPSEMSMDGEF